METRDHPRMKHSATRYKRHRFPLEIVQYAVWLDYRFNLSHRDIEDLLARRGVVVTHESIRRAPCTTPVGMRTTGPSCRINRPGYESGG